MQTKSSPEEKIEQLQNDFQQYAYAVSHDFSAPIRQIQGFTDLIRKEIQSTADKKTLDHLTHIENAASKARNMLEGMLAYSRIESQAETPAQVDLNIAFEKARSSILELADKNVIQCEKLPSIVAEPKHMQILFTELLKNALTFQPEQNEIQIEVTCKYRDDGFDIMITDNGIGLLNEDAESLQQLYAPLRKGRSDIPSQGPGMGLALTKRIMQRIDGTVAIADSAKAEGTTVTLSFKS